MKTLCTVFLTLFCFGMEAWGHSSTTKPGQKPPFKGMTKVEVFARYGEPFHRGHRDGQDVWYYHLKFDEVWGREMGAFAVGRDNVTLGEIAFDAHDRVARYVWNYTNLR